MRILMLSQWFQPEPHLNKGLPFAQELRRRGHDVQVLTGFPNYPGGTLYPGYRIRPFRKEVLEGVPLLRVALFPSHSQSGLGRAINYLSFAFSATIGILFLRRPDVVYVFHPPGTAAAPAVVLRLIKRVPFVLDVQDLWPDTLAATGMIGNSLALRLVGAWMAFVYRRAAAIAVLSSGFKARLAERNVPETKLHVIRNWAPEEGAGPGLEAPASEGSNSSFEIVFAGNIGKAQALQTVVDAAAMLKGHVPQIRFSLVGDGVETGRLRGLAGQAGLDNLRFVPRRPPEQMAEIFASADALLVHLRDDPLFEITIPSKTQAYLRAGKPILMGAAGDAAAMVEEAAAGIAFAPENPLALRDAVLALMAMPAEARRAMGENGARYYSERLALSVGASEFETLLFSAAGQSRSGAPAEDMG